MEIQPYLWSVTPGTGQRRRLHGEGKEFKKQVQRKLFLTHFWGENADTTKMTLHGDVKV